jgi:hypothetical protein
MLNILAILYILAIVTVLGYSVVVCRNYEYPAEEPYTNTTAVTNKSYVSQMWEMSTEPEFYNMALYSKRKANTYDMTVIPGLKCAETINCDTKEIDGCTSMTPQGLAVTDTYTYISAYCSTKEHRSVIFVLDTKTGKYVKTLVLKNTTHAGGLAYDTKNDMLWVSSYLSVEEEDGKVRRASISCITLASIEKYDMYKKNKAIAYRNTCEIMFPATSFVTIYGGYLYVGYWKKDKDSQSMAAGYEITNGGTAIAKEADQSFYIPGRVQGMQVYRNNIILSISYGLDDSKIEVYNMANGELSNINYKSQTPEQTISLPQKLEQIYSYNGKLYCLFESGSYAYRMTAPVCMSWLVNLDESSMVE